MRFSQRIDPEPQALVIGHHEGGKAADYGEDRSEQRPIVLDLFDGQCDMVLSRRPCPLPCAASSTEKRSGMLQFAAARDWRISSVVAMRAGLAMREPLSRRRHRRALTAWVTNCRFSRRAG